jgi:hypothetical protein
MRTPDPMAITGLADAVRDIHAVRRHGNANLRLNVVGSNPITRYP